MAISFSKQMLVEAVKQILVEHETDPNLELTVGDYQTKHYHMCPGAKTLYQDIESKVEDMDLAVRAAKLQDALFAMEEMALERGATEADVFAAEAVASQIMSMAQMMGLEQEHSYIQGHVDKIKAAADGVEEAVTQMHVTATNKPDIKAALKKKGVIDTTSVDKAKPGEVIAVEETISVGHVDDEPGMLKQYAFDTAEYAVKLYKLLHHYEQMEDHVDFPNWWQHKVMMAREYISKATHYLEFETKEPEIDAQIDNAPPEVDLEEARDYQALVGQEVMFGSRYATVVGEEGDYIRLKFEDGKENLVTKKDFENKQPGVNEKFLKEDEEIDDKDFSKKDAAKEKGFVAQSNVLQAKAARKKALKPILDKLEKSGVISRVDGKLKVNDMDAYKKAIAAINEAVNQVLAESKATCCGKCGRTHVKGTECKKPYLTGKDHCRVR